MPKAKNEVEIYQSRSKNKDWRWRLKTSNGKIIGSSSEGYASKATAKRNIASLAKALGTAEIVVISPKKAPKKATKAKKKATKVAKAAKPAAKVTKPRAAKAPAAKGATKAPRKPRAAKKADAPDLKVVA